MIWCPRCQCANKAHALFCKECGTSLVDALQSSLQQAVAVCSQCGTPIPESTSYCRTCGTPVGAPIPEARYRRVSSTLSKQQIEIPNRAPENLSGALTPTILTPGPSDDQQRCAACGEPAFCGEDLCSSCAAALEVTADAVPNQVEHAGEPSPDPVTTLALDLSDGQQGCAACGGPTAGGEELCRSCAEALGVTTDTVSRQAEPGGEEPKSGQ